MNQLSHIRAVLKEDPTWQKFRSTVKNCWQPEFDEYIEEIKRLHAGRSVRTIDAKMPTGRSIGEAAARDQMVRSRCVEIAMNVTIVRNILAASLKNVQKYVEAKYWSWMASSLDLRSVNDRKNLVGAILAPYYERFDSAQTIIDIADMVITDCDRSSYAIKHMTEALTVATRREGA